MIIARVVGSAVSTVKPAELRGLKLLVLREATPADETVGEAFVAVDAVGAGEGELVLVARGSAARNTPETEGRPVDALIMAILDSLEVDGAVSFRKS